MVVKIGALTFQSAKKNSHLLAEPVRKALEQWDGIFSVDEILVTEIDPEFSDSNAFCKKYGIAQSEVANCLIVEAKRGGILRYAACLVPVNTRANINSVVRKYLNARQVSFAPKDYAVNASGMEYGSITIFGLPADWQLLIDESLTYAQHLIIGGGLRKSKLLVPGKILKDMPNAAVLSGLTMPLI